MAFVRPCRGIAASGHAEKEADYEIPKNAGHRGRREPQQLELRFGAVEGLSYPSAFFGAVAIPATKRNTVSSHGDVCCKYVFLHID